MFTLASLVFLTSGNAHAQGTESVRALATSQNGAHSISLTAPSTVGTFYYGGCVDTVSRESSTTGGGDGNHLQAVAASGDTKTTEPDPVVVDLSITGPSDNRVDIVFVGNDYTEDELDTFADVVDQIRRDLFTLSPFREYRGYFNVRRIDLAAGQNQLSGSPARQRAALEHLEPDQHEILMLVRKKSGSVGFAWTLSWVDSEGNSRWTGVAHGMVVAPWTHKIFIRSARRRDIDGFAPARGSCNRGPRGRVGGIRAAGHRTRTSPAVRSHRLGSYPEPPDQPSRLSGLGAVNPRRREYQSHRQRD